MVEAQVTYGVVAHVKRTHLADRLISRLDAVSHYDDGSIGSNANHDLVWRETARAASDWVCILEDDAVVSDTFESDLVAALSNAPERSFVGLYVGGERPPQWMPRVKRAVSAADRRSASWLSLDWLLWGVAVAAPVELVEPMLSGVRFSAAPYDFRIGQWIKSTGRLVYYPWPCLVDHADLPTLINHGDGDRRNKPRRAIKTGPGGQGNTVVRI